MDFINAKETCSHLEEKDNHICTNNHYSDCSIGICGDCLSFNQGKCRF